MEKKEISFEEKMGKLETIIKELEEGNVNLDDSIKKYTEAMILIKECDEKLKSVEEQISNIVAEDGTISSFSVEE